MKETARTGVLCVLAGLLAMSPGVLAQEGPAPEPAPIPQGLVKVVLKSGGLTVVEVKAEDDGQMALVDLRTGKETKVPRAEVQVLDADVTDEKAVDTVGLAPFMAWKVRRLLDLRTQGKVADVTPTSIYVTLGRRDGIEEGQKLVVYREGEELTDPDTGEVLGKIRLKTAELEVTEVEDKFCKAKRLGEIEAELVRGDVVDLADARRAVAVFPVTDASGESVEAAYGLAEEWTTTLAQWDIPVVERRQLDRVLVELGLQYSGLFDPDTASKVGKLVGAFAVMTGSVGPARPGHAVVHARLVRVSTGEVLLAASEEVAEAERAALRRPALTAAAPAVAAGGGGTDTVVEGVGWGAARIGATRDEVKAAFGQPEDTQPYWLNYRRSRGIDVFYGQSDRAVEVRFNAGFRGRLQSGISIGSSLEQVVAAYGEPVRTERVAQGAQNLFDNRVLYRMPAASKLMYSDRGILFWFDGRDRVSQFVVSQPAGSAPPAPAAPAGGGAGAPNTPVSLRRPYPKSYDGASTDRMSLQYAVIELAQQAGLGYNWDQSYNNTNPVCRRWVTPNIENVPFDQAMRQLLDPLGLTYNIVDNSVVLRRR
jgi:hypothetical protein